MTQTSPLIPTFETLKVPVHAVQIPETIALIRQWASERSSCRYIVLGGMHGVMEAQRSEAVMATYRDANLVVPDGMPLVWISRLRGYKLRRRVYGPELVEAACAALGSEFKHYFYGGNEAVAEQMAGVLKERYGIVIAGCYSPPFRPLSDAEKAADIARINDSKADIVWVGIGAPKQELWMHANAPFLTAGVALGVGAAFDFITGKKAIAPAWMQENGLEWLFRLVTEPRRLWRRYLQNMPPFVAKVTLEELRRRFS